MSTQQRIGVYPGTFDPLTLGHLDIIRRGEQPGDRASFPIEIDIAFHRTILHMTENAHLDALLAPCWQATRSVVVASAAATWSADDTARMAVQHRAVFEALRVGDAEVAGFEMERHLRAELARLTSGTSPEGPPSRFFA